MWKLNKPILSALSVFKILLQGDLFFTPIIQILR